MEEEGPKRPGTKRPAAGVPEQEYQYDPDMEGEHLLQGVPTPVPAAPAPPPLVPPAHPCSAGVAGISPVHRIVALKTLSTPSGTTSEPPAHTPERPSAYLAETYRRALVKAAAKSMEGGSFPLLVVDAPHARAEHLREVWVAGQKAGYEVVVVEPLCSDPQVGAGSCRVCWGDISAQTAIL